MSDNCHTCRHLQATGQLIRETAYWRITTHGRHGLRATALEHWASRDELPELALADFRFFVLTICRYELNCKDIEVAWVDRHADSDHHDQHVRAEIRSKSAKT
jgi:hypothetical protein